MSLDNSDKINLKDIREILRYSLIIQAVIAALLLTLIIQGG
jgi:hypothetical protein